MILKITNSNYKLSSIIEEIHLHLKHIDSNINPTQGEEVPGAPPPLPKGQPFYFLIAPIFNENGRRKNGDKTNSLYST